MIQINDFPTYIHFVLKTESIERSGRWQEHLPDRIYRVNHGLTGLTTEIGELADAIMANSDIDWVNVMEELGDCWWYCGILVDELFDARPQLEDPVLHQRPLLTHIRDTMFDMMGNVGGGMDVIKRRIYYNAGDDKPKANWDLIKDYRLPRIIDNLILLQAYCGIDLKETWSRNITKLDERYNGAFSQEAALMRDEAAERKVLES